MTRHSNMVVFGTNTVVGVRVGTNATQVPSIDIGYTRQEAVLMPVVANTGIEKDEKATEKLTPCEIDDTVQIVAGNPAPSAGSALPVFATHPCLLVATDGRNAKDSYSVLASFGADFGASSEPSKATAKGGLAQYFATGMAAQLLALNGGAAVVATGQAAEKASENAPMTLSGVAALTPTPADAARAAPAVASYKAARELLASKVRLTAPGDLVARFDAFQSALGGGKPNIMVRCDSPGTCAAKIADDDFFLSNYNADPVKFANAVENWR
ncbi:MAG: hypothetical protein KJZ64_01365 [Sphingomonadaceae bacterium]|nr:hypothetical protein [Sphingomonadaceae bacterium]